jgi:C-type mannose receptor
LRSSNVWIGFNRNTANINTFQWSDNSPITFLNWDSGQPDNFNNNEFCIEMRTSQKWNDISCYVERGWTCKIPKGTDLDVRPIEINEIFPSI